VFSDHKDRRPPHRPPRPNGLCDVLPRPCIAVSRVLYVCDVWSSKTISSGNLPGVECPILQEVGRDRRRDVDYLWEI
jgi:hypothetical protein